MYVFALHLCVMNDDYYYDDVDDDSCNSQINVCACVPFTCRVGLAHRFTVMSSVSFSRTRSPKFMQPLTQPQRIFVRARTGASFRSLTPVSANDIATAIRQLPDMDRCSAADPITYVLKRIADLIAPFVDQPFNRSLDSGHFPVGFKEAFIAPVMKKSGLDLTDHKCNVLRASVPPCKIYSG